MLVAGDSFRELACVVEIFALLKMALSLRGGLCVWYGVTVVSRIFRRVGSGFRRRGRRRLRWRRYQRRLNLNVPILVLLQHQQPPRLGEQPRQRMLPQRRTEPHQRFPLRHRQPRRKLRPPGRPVRSRPQGQPLPGLLRLLLFVQSQGLAKGRFEGCWGQRFRGGLRPAKELAKHQGVQLRRSPLV